MAELSVITDCTEPDELYAAYRDFSARYERICDEIDGLDRQLRDATDQDEGSRLTAELGALTDDSMVVLGWVSAAFAAYIFAIRGTHTDRLNAAGSTTLSNGARSVVVPNTNRGRR